MDAGRTTEGATVQQTEGTAVRRAEERAGDGVGAYRPGIQDVLDVAALLERAADAMERCGRDDVAASHRLRARALRADAR